MMMRVRPNCLFIYFFFFILFMFNVISIPWHGHVLGLSSGFQKTENSQREEADRYLVLTINKKCWTKCFINQTKREKKHHLRIEPCSIFLCSFYNLSIIPAGVGFTLGYIAGVIVDFVLDYTTLTTAASPYTIWLPRNCRVQKSCSAVFLLGFQIL